MYLFGPLINAPPAHPATVLTSVIYMMQSLTDLGMTYIHLSPDMQLYIQAMKIKWNEPQAFDKLILRPGVMHIFVLLVYWTWRCDLDDRLAVQMKKWDGVVLDGNATCAHLGSTVCSQLLGAHAITGCDTVSYPFGKGNASMLKTLKEGDFPGLFDVLGEEGASQEDLMAVREQFFVALYGQPSGSSMTEARYNLYTRKQGKPMRIMSLPPTDLNLFLHVKRTHLQMLLWKAADQLGDPRRVICPSI